MIAPRALSDDEFRSCFAEPMRDVTTDGDASVDIWPYVDALDLDILGIPSVHDVRNVYRDARGWYDQVLVGTGRFNALLVVVVDRRDAKIFGHHLLDVNREYGNDRGHMRLVR
jgi:hypothetical protein